MKSKKRFSVVVAVFVVFVLAMSFVGCGNKNKCAHEWVAATCTEDEYCAHCGIKGGKATGHKYVYATVDPTCDDAGSKNGECSVCHNKTTEYLPKLSHRYVSKVEEGDCETDTVTIYTCELCKDAYSEVTKRHEGHDTTDVTWTVKSEEQEDSSCKFLVTETAKCGTCKKDIERTYHKHVAKWMIDDIEYATCKEEGTVYYVCVCGDAKYAKTEVLPVNPAAHMWSVSDKAGITHECDECGATKSEVVIDGHSATLSAEQLSGENIAIKTAADVTLMPDTTLASKMSGGVNIAATSVATDDLPQVDEAIAEKLENAYIFNFELKNTDDQAIDFDGGKMTISLPYYLDPWEDPTTVAVLYIDAEGKEEFIDAIYGAGMATFTVEHFSHYAVVRLTAVERCAMLGHVYDETDFAPTCTEDGYTVKSCRRCGDFVRVEGAKKLGHDYKATEVPATCTEKGYTLMVCSHSGCDDSYVTKYTAMLAHDYTDTVVAPSCTVKGYTAHVCKNCGESYRDAYTDTVAHNFVNGECTVCHKKSEVSSDKYFYLNLVNSLGETDGYYLEIANSAFELKTVFTAEEGEESQVVTGKVDLLKMSVALDDDGYLVGSGEGKVSFTMTDESEDIGSDQKVLLAFKNKNIYLYVYEAYIGEMGKTVAEMYSVVSQDDESLAALKGTVKAYYTDEVKTVVEKLLAAQNENNPLNTVATKMFEALFDKAETQSGYTLTLNYDKTAKLLKFVNENNGEAVFDAIFGEGEFASLLEFVGEVPEMKFGDFVNKLVAKATSYGLTQSDIYEIIDSVMTKISDGNKFSFAEFLKNYNTSTVPEMIELMSGGEMEAEQVSEMITGMVEYYGQALTDEELSLVDFVCGMFAESEMGEMIPVIKEFALTTLEALNTAAEKTVKVVISTDASGAFEEMTVKFDDFAFDTEVPGGFEDGKADVELSAGISITVTAGIGVIGDNNNIVTTADNARKAFTEAVKNNDGTPFESGHGEDHKYQIVKNGDDYMIVPVLEYDKYILNSGNIQNYREGTYEGKECAIVDYTGWSGSYILKLDGEYSFYKSCNGWVENIVANEYIHYTVFTLYIDEKYDLLGYELNFEAMEAYKNGEHFTTTVYTNSVLGKLSLATPHKYSLIEKKEPTTCEETGYEKYRCTVCGNIIFRYYSISHDFDRTYTLKDETLGCEGGVIEVAKCTKCGKEESREIPGVYEDGSHRNLRLTYPIADAKCPDTHVEVYGCACGENIDHVEVRGGCEFKRINYEECMVYDYETGCEHGGYIKHRIETYQCSVSACGYTYTREEYTTRPDENCEGTDSRSITLADGTKYVRTYKYTQHIDRVTSEEKEGDLTVYTYACDNCHKATYVSKRDSYQRSVYYFDLIEKRGWEREYDLNCYYVEYALDENGDRTERVINQGFDHHMTYKRDKKTSCTQAHREIYTCSICNVQVDERDYYYGHDFREDPESGEYACKDCGMINSIYADGPIVLENLSSGGSFRIGYTAYREILEVRFCEDYTGEGSGTPIDGVNGNPMQTGERCGILDIYFGSAAEWLAANPEATFTVVFETRARSDNYDGYPDYLEISITFTAEELAEILGIELDLGGESELAA